jgi:hypothetical protein
MSETLGRCFVRERFQRVDPDNCIEIAKALALMGWSEGRGFVKLAHASGFERCALETAVSKNAIARLYSPRQRPAAAVAAIRTLPRAAARNVRVRETDSLGWAAVKRGMNPLRGRARVARVR